MKQLNFKVLEIDATIASKLLATNKHNRLLNEVKINTYSNDMINGKWELNGEPLIIDSNGELIDGMHRVSAIIKSNVSCSFVIISGVDPKSRQTIDTGKSRNLSDALKIEGANNTARLSSGIKLYIKLRNGYAARNSTSIQLTNMDSMIEYFNNKSEYDDLVMRGSVFYTKSFKILSPGEFIAFYRYFKLKYTNDIIDSFFNSIVDNNKGVCKLLFVKLLNNKIAKRTMAQSERNALIIKSFLYYVSGKPITLLKYSVDENFPSIFTFKP